MDVTTTHPLRAGPSLPPAAARAYRLRAIFEAGKIDPQVADTSVLAPFPLVLQECNAAALHALAERLAAEALAAERELLQRPDLHRNLALPRQVRRALRHAPSPGANHPRLARLDFHWATTADNQTPRWIVSEINADVPGGFIEAGALPAIMLDALGHAARDARLTPPPDPAAALARAIRARVDAANCCNSCNNPASTTAPLVALVHATAFADDRQVMDRLASALHAVGVETTPAAPDHLAWDHDGLARDLRTDRPLAALARFYPAEWLDSLTTPWGFTARWRGFFTGLTPMTNPAHAVLTQSKRWTLLASRLNTPLPTWNACLPETRDPRRVDPALIPDQWTLKPALGRVGEGILIPGLEPREARAIRRAARRHPAHFIAQRRFHSLPIDSPLGPLHVALGVYVVDGQPAGFYARAAARPLIDQNAWELPVLLAEPRPLTPLDQPNPANSANSPATPPRPHAHASRIPALAHPQEAP